MVNTLGYDPNKLAGETYYTSVVTQMARWGFDLIGQTYVDSNQFAYHVDWYAYSRNTQLIFKHRELALVVILSHRETAGITERGGEADPNHYDSYWGLTVTWDWESWVDPREVDNATDLFHLADYSGHNYTGGSSWRHGGSSSGEAVNMDVHAASDNGDWLWDQQIDARTLCMPILQFLANARCKIKEGKMESIRWYSICPSFIYPGCEAAFAAQARNNGLIDNLKKATDEIFGL